MSELVKTEEKANLANKQPSQSERFTAEVMKQFTNNAGQLELTSFQRKLIQNYFIRIDQTLKDLEKKRLMKDEKYRDPVAFEWRNVNLAKLAVDVVAYSSVGLDPVQPNQINCIPYLNSSTKKFDIGFIVGFKGLELKVKKYGLDIPDAVVVELVYKNDKFRQLKKDINNRIENYEFEITDNFNRGELVGGFYYLIYNEKPEKNKLRVFSKADIDKRKPSYAAVEFWGGERDKWEYDSAQKKRVKNGTEKVEGWYDEMAYKTIYRAAYNSLTIDAEKIDDHYRSMLELEREVHDEKIMLEIEKNANKGESLMIEDTAQEITIQDAVVIKEEEAEAETVSAQTLFENEKKSPGF